MSRFVADPAAMMDTVDRMAAFGTQLEQALDSACHRVERLHAAWTGEAAEQHRQTHEQWVRGVRGMHTAVTTLRAITAVAAQNYADAAAANLRMWTI